MSIDYSQLYSDIRGEQPSYEEDLICAVNEVYADIRDVTADSEGRKDVRNMDTYTIDPADAKDFDDAISVERIYDEDGLDGYRALVHITDVPHYIDEDDVIDHTVQEQAFTDYASEPVKHMLPDRLADELSLVEGKDRLVNTIELRFDDDGQFEEHDIYRSVINTDRNLSYDEANKYVRMSSRDPDLRERGKKLVTDLEDFAFLTRRLASASGRSHLDRTPAYRIIEELMVTANELGAHELQGQDGGVYRVHDGSHALAQYSTDCGPHVGLETDAYAHFTSPIRRYSDLLNWRAYWNTSSLEEDDLSGIVDHLNEREIEIETDHLEETEDSLGLDR